MSSKLDEWAQEMKETHGQQITTRLKTQIKKNTKQLLKTIKDKEIDFGEFADGVNSSIARISFLKRTLKGMLSDDLRDYKDYLRACIIEGYTLKFDDDKHILEWLEKNDHARAQKLRKLKGILLRKITKYGS